MKPKILIFIDWFTPGFKAGGPIRSVHNLTDHLADDYEFYVITTDTDYCENDPYPFVKSNAWNELAPHLKVYYFSRDHLNYTSLKSLIHQTDFDVAYINGIYSWYFSILPLLIIRKLNKKVVVSPRGMMSGQAFSSGKLKKKVFIALSKLAGWYKKTTWQSTNEQEKKDIQQHISRKSRIFPAPNLPKKARSNQKRIIKKEQNQLRLVNIARIAPEKNNEFAIKILLKQSGKDITLDLYGPVYNQEYWEKCQQLINKVPSSVKVNYMGAVDPDGLENVLAKYHFLLFPSIGENFGHAIYEALAFGIPVIVSDKTPWKNLERNAAGWDLPLHDQHKWTNVINQCYGMDQDEYDILSAGAKNLAHNYIDQSDFKEQYRQLFQI